MTENHNELVTIFAAIQTHGFTEQFIRDFTGKLPEQIAEAEADLTDESRAVRSAAADFKVSQLLLQRLSSEPPTDTIQRIESIFTAARNLSDQGLDDRQIAGKISEEFGEDVFVLYDLLREQYSGYSLGQRVIGHQRLT